MSCQDKLLLQLDPEYRKLIMDLTISYLSDNPSDFVTYACDFFNTKIKNREAKKFNKLLAVVELENEEDGYRSCRASVRGESFNPEEQEDFIPEVHPKTDFQRNKINKTLEPILFFKSLDEQDKSNMIEAMCRKIVTTNDLIIKEGDSGDYLYIIEAGMFEAFKTTGEADEILKCYKNEGYFGELALLHDTPRALSVKAKTDGVLWALDRSTFRKILLISNYKRIKEYIHFLKSVPILDSLSLEERFTLAECLISKHYKDGEQIVNVGEVGDGMYFMVSGKAKIVKKSSEMDLGDNLLKIVSEGEYFGELSLIMKKPRAASVYAMGNVKVAFLPLDSFERLLGPCIEVMKRNFEEYDKQLQNILSATLTSKGNNTVRKESSTN